MMEQEKKRLKISIFDIIIVAVILAAALVVFVIFKPKDMEIIPVPSTAMRYTVEISRMPEGAAALIQPGDQIRDSIKNYDIGTVVSAEAAPFTTLVPEQSTGIVKNAELDMYENVLVTIEAKMNTSTTALTTESGFTLTVGSEVFVSGPCYAGKGFIVSIER